MQKFTKIVATVSDKRCETDFIKSLAEAGVNVVRMNSAHLDYDGFKKIVDNTREAAEYIGIIMDTKGPEIRTTPTVDGREVEYHTGDKVRIYGNPDGHTSSSEISLNYDKIGDVLKVGDRLLIDDGEVEFLVTEANGSEIVATAQNDGHLGSRKSVNIPGVKIDLPAVTERDRRNIGYAVERGVDFIAHSFVSPAADVK
ncbi:MAG: pyruvate kinase, partial [Muribaculaceae bacterium]|nr:pyruvate kinase [Muribaculaceae bacterium]